MVKLPDKVIGLPWTYSLPISLQILSAAVHYGEPTDVVTLAVTATQCMREVAVGKEVKEYRAPGKDQKKLTEKVKMANMLM